MYSEGSSKVGVDVTLEYVFDAPEMTRPVCVVESLTLISSSCLNRKYWLDDRLNSPWSVSRSCRLGEDCPVHTRSGVIGLHSGAYAGNGCRGGGVLSSRNCSWMVNPTSEELAMLYG